MPPSSKPRLTEDQRQSILRLQRERAVAIADRKLPASAKKVYHDVTAFQLMNTEAEIERKIRNSVKWSAQWWYHVSRLDICRRELIRRGAVVMP